MKTPIRYILLASISSAVALAQEAERNPPPPAPDRPPGEGRPVPPPPRPDRDNARGERPSERREGERRLGGDADRPRPDGDRPRPDGDRPRPDGERVRPEGDRPRPEGERPRGEGERPRETDRPRPEGARPNLEADRRRLESDLREGRRPEGDQQRRDFLTRLPEKPQPFLGIVTRDASPDLAAQLRQPEGFGLVVEEVLPDSPAKAAGLERNDLLLRFDDQLLVNPPQLEALVRRVGKDKEATLTILRAGAEQKITIRVGEKMLPERRMFRGPLDRGPGSGGGGGSSEANPRRLPLRSEAEPGRVREERERSVRYTREHARVMRNDEQGRFELLSIDGVRTFIAQRPDGTVQWTGPVQTPEQREKIPADLRAKLELLEKGIVAEPPRPTHGSAEGARR